MSIIDGVVAAAGAHRRIRREREKRAIYGLHHAVAAPVCVSIAGLPALEMKDFVEKKGDCTGDFVPTTRKNKAAHPSN